MRSDIREEYPLSAFGAHALARALAQLDKACERLGIPLEFEQKSFERTRPGFGTKGLIFLLALAMLPVAFGLWTAWEQWRMTGWPQSPATIVKFEPNVSEEPGMHWNAYPLITFRYQVAGANYIGHSLNPSPWNYQRPERFAADTGVFKAGAIIPCWYNPQRPQVAYVVNTGVTADAALLLALGAVIAGPSAFLIRGLRRSRRVFQEFRLTKPAQHSERLIFCISSRDAARHKKSHSRQQ